MSGALPYVVIVAKIYTVQLWMKSADGILALPYSQSFGECMPMLRAYRLVYPISQHAPPQLWEFEQPYIDNLLLNARTFDRRVVQWYFEDWAALDRDNTRIWNTHYHIKTLFDHLPTWQEWLPEHRQLIIEVQEMVEEHTAQGTWRRPV
jgi:hypothetical protein